MFRSTAKHFTSLFNQAYCAKSLRILLSLLKYEGKAYMNKMRQIRCFCVQNKGKDKNTFLFANFQKIVSS